MGFLYHYRLIIKLADTETPCLEWHKCFHRLTSKEKKKSLYILSYQRSKLRIDASCHIEDVSMETKLTIFPLLSLSLAGTKLIKAVLLSGAYSLISSSLALWHLSVHVCVCLSLSVCVRHLFINSLTVGFHVFHCCQDQRSRNKVHYKL